MLDESKIQITVDGLPDDFEAEEGALTATVQPGDDEEEGLDSESESGDDELDLGLDDETEAEPTGDMGDDELSMDVPEEDEVEEATDVSMDETDDNDEDDEDGPGMKELIDSTDKDGKESYLPNEGRKPRGLRLTENTVLEINENELKAELQNMKALREGRSTPKTKPVVSEDTVALKKKLNEYKSAIRKLHAKLVESSLLNCKLAHVNKLLQRENVSSKRKGFIVKRLNEARTDREVKLIYDSLVDTHAETSLSESTRSKQVLGSSSRVTRPASTVALNESVERQEYNRWAQIAGIPTDEK